jgi:hypothetical protein
VRKLVLGAVVLALIAVGVFWVLPAARYDDVEQGGAQWSEPHGSYHFGRLTEVGASVRNAGSRDLRVTAVGTESGARMSRGGAIVRDSELVPFAPFTLHPGDEREVVFRVRLPSCSDVEPGSATVVGTFDVRYDVLVFHHRRRVPLREPLKFKRGKRCP